MEDKVGKIWMERCGEFIREHRSDDVRRLALQAGRYPDVDMPFVLQQIAGWQVARTKLPSWAAVEDICYPPHISMEQCSSEQTAQYKASLMSRISGDSEVLVDLTGGFGVDFSYMSCGFQRAVYVERQEQLCEVARHNFRLLQLENSEVVCGDGEEYLHQIPAGMRVCIYLDPARRDLQGKKTYAISDCTPDVLTLKDELLQKASCVMVKLSPMLDWHKAVDDLGDVREVHIVSVGNECKELLVVLGACGTGQEETVVVPEDAVRVYCVNILGNGRMEMFEFKYPSGVSTAGESGFAFSGEHAGLFLYEPNASLMKAGCFAELARCYAVQPVSRSSHLFVSDHLVNDIPCRKFQISAVSTMNKKQLKTALQGLTKANIAVRNFPLSVAELRKRLKLADGGDIYVFATTDQTGEHVLLFSKKV